MTFGNPNSSNSPFRRPPVFPAYNAPDPFSRDAFAAAPPGQAPPPNDPFNPVPSPFASDPAATLGQPSGFASAADQPSGFPSAAGQPSGFASASGQPSGFASAAGQPSGFASAAGLSSGFGSAAGLSSGFGSAAGLSSGFASAPSHPPGFGAGPAPVFPPSSADFPPLPSTSPPPNDPFAPPPRRSPSPAASSTEPYRPFAPEPRSRIRPRDPFASSGDAPSGRERAPPSHDASGLYGPSGFPPPDYNSPIYTSGREGRHLDSSGPPNDPFASHPPWRGGPSSAAPQSTAAPAAPGSHPPGTHFNKIFLKSVPPELFSRDAIEQHFRAQCGAIVTDVSLRGNLEPQSRRTAAVTLASDEHAQLALREGVMYNNRKLPAGYFRTHASGVSERPAPPESKELVFTYIPEELFSKNAITNLFNTISNNGVSNISTKERLLRDGKVRRTAIVTFVDVDRARTAMKNLPQYNNQKLCVNFRHTPAHLQNQQQQQQQFSTAAVTTPGRRSEREHTRVKQEDFPAAGYDEDMNAAADDHYGGDEDFFRGAGSASFGAGMKDFTSVVSHGTGDARAHSKHSRPREGKGPPLDADGYPIVLDYRDVEAANYEHSKRVARETRDKERERKEEEKNALKAKIKKLEDLQRRRREADLEEGRLRDRNSKVSKDNEASQDPSPPGGSSRGGNGDINHGQGLSISARASKMFTAQRTANDAGDGDKWRGTGEKVDIKNAVTFVGTCEMMCPEKEFDERWEQGDVSMFEKSNGEFDREKAVKKYRRSAAVSEQPTPEEVRPPHVLRRTMDYLRDICDQDKEFTDIHHFVRDRTRSLRQDFTLQGAKDETCIAIHEESVRFHILSEHRLFGEDPAKFSSKQNIEQLDKCLISLREMYDIRREDNLSTSVNEPEMQAYYLLTQMSNPKTCVQILSGFSQDVRCSASVQFALRVMRAASPALGNAATYFRCVREAPYLAACLLHSRFTEVRLRAMATMNEVTGTPNVPDEHSVSNITGMLGFEDCDEALTFCETLGFQVCGLDGPAGNACILTPSKKFNSDSIQLWVQRRAENLIESKVEGKTVSSIIATNNFPNNALQPETPPRPPSSPKRQQESIVDPTPSKRSKPSILARIGSRSSPDPEPSVPTNRLQQAANEILRRNPQLLPEVEFLAKPVAPNQTQTSANPLEGENNASPSQAIPETSETKKPWPGLFDTISGTRSKDSSATFPGQVPVFGGFKEPAQTPFIPTPSQPETSSLGPSNAQATSPFDTGITNNVTGSNITGKRIPSTQEELVPASVDETADQANTSPPPELGPPLQPAKIVAPSPPRDPVTPDFPGAPSPVQQLSEASKEIEVTPQAQEEPPCTLPDNEQPRVLPIDEQLRTLPSDEQRRVLPDEEQPGTVSDNGQPTTLLDDGQQEADDSPQQPLPEDGNKETQPTQAPAPPPISEEEMQLRAEINEHRTNVHRALNMIHNILSAIWDSEDRLSQKANCLDCHGKWAEVSEAEVILARLSKFASKVEQVKAEAVQLDNKKKWIGAEITAETENALQPFVRQANYRWNVLWNWLQHVDGFLPHVKLLVKPYSSPDAEKADETVFDLVTAREEQKPTLFKKIMNPDFPERAFCLRDMAAMMVTDNIRRAQVAMVNMTSFKSDVALRHAQVKVCKARNKSPGAVKTLTVEDGSKQHDLSVVNVTADQAFPVTADVIVAGIDCTGTPQQLGSSIARLREKLTQLSQAQRLLKLGQSAVVVVQFIPHTAHAGRDTFALKQSSLNTLAKEGLAVSVHLVNIEDEDVDQQMSKAMVLGLRERYKTFFRQSSEQRIDHLLEEAGQHAWMRHVAKSEACEDMGTKLMELLGEVNSAWKHVGDRLVREMEKWPEEIGGNRTELEKITKEIRDRLRFPGPEELGAETIFEYEEKLVAEVGKPEARMSKNSEKFHELPRFGCMVSDLIPVVVRHVLGDAAGKRVLMLEEPGDRYERRENVRSAARFRAMDLITLRHPKTAEASNEVTERFVGVRPQKRARASSGGRLSSCGLSGQKAELIHAGFTTQILDAMISEEEQYAETLRQTEQLVGEWMHSDNKRRRTSLGG